MRSPSGLADIGADAGYLADLPELASPSGGSGGKVRGGLSSTTSTLYCQLGVGGGGRENVAALRVASAGASG